MCDIARSMRTAHRLDEPVLRLGPGLAPAWPRLGPGLTPGLAQLGVFFDVCFLLALGHLAQNVRHRRQNGVGFGLRYVQKDR